MKITPLLVAILAAVYTAPISSFQGIAIEPRPALAEKDSMLIKVTSQPCEDLNVCHEIANIFEQRVGDYLKSNWPSQVLSPYVQINALHEDGKKKFTISYWCQVTRVVPPLADWSFARRGTILLGKNPRAAQDAVEKEIETSGKVRKLLEGSTFRVPNESFIRSDWNITTNGTWYIQEFFFVAKRPA